MFDDPTSYKAFRQLPEVFEKHNIVEPLKASVEKLGDFKQACLSFMCGTFPSEAWGSGYNDYVLIMLYRYLINELNGEYLHPIYPDNISIDDDNTDFTILYNASCITEYEDMLNIKRNETETFDYRKTRVRRQISNKRRYSINYVKKFFETWGVPVELTLNGFNLTVDASPTDLLKKPEINRLLDLFIPMNIYYSGTTENISHNVYVNDILNISSNYWSYSLSGLGASLADDNDPFLKNTLNEIAGFVLPTDNLISEYATAMSNAGAGVIKTYADGTERSNVIQTAGASLFSTQMECPASPTTVNVIKLSVNGEKMIETSPQGIETGGQIKPVLLKFPIVKLIALGLPDEDDYRKELSNLFTNSTATISINGGSFVSMTKTDKGHYYAFDYTCSSQLTAWTITNVEIKVNGNTVFNQACNIEVAENVSPMFSYAVIGKVY